MIAVFPDKCFFFHGFEACQVGVQRIYIYIYIYIYTHIYIYTYIYIYILI